MRRLKTQAQLAAQCDSWNARVPIGSEVEYHPVIGEAAHRVRKTQSLAFILSGHTACVFLQGESGCVAVDACVPLAEVKPS